MSTAKMKITGMHCVSCKSLIEEVCREAAGVKSCIVNFESGVAEIEHDESLDLAALIKEIEELENYKVEKL